MTKLIIGVVAVVLVACFGVPTLLVSSIMGGAPGGCGLAAGPAVRPSGQLPGIGAWDAGQLSIAATIIDVGVAKGVPRWGWVIAVATAMQESGLRDLPLRGDRNEHDSVGVFQQRPSQGWGTVEQLSKPAYQAGTFFDKLLAVPGWQTMPLARAAQAVQASAFPDAYAAWTDDAVHVVERVGSSGNRAMSVDLEQCLSSCPAILSSGASIGPSAAASATGSPCEWVAPVRAPVVSGFRTPDRPAHNGVDLGAARGTPIVAASAGVVVVVRCNVVPASHGCDRDGSPSTPGCGWYVDLRHADEVYARYCHMLTRPAVVEGQTVVAGQVIGVVGSSGHSSGPHLHFEVHLGGRNEGAVDPVVFMAGRGVRLG